MCSDAYDARKTNDHAFDVCTVCNAHTFVRLLDFLCAQVYALFLKMSSFEGASLDLPACADPSPPEEKAEEKDPICEFSEDEEDDDDEVEGEAGNIRRRRIPQPPVFRRFIGHRNARYTRDKLSKLSLLYE